MLLFLRARLLIIAVLLCSLTYADESSLKIDECFADQLVGGCIDPVHGIFLDHVVDLAIPSSGNLSVERNHNSHRYIPTINGLSEFSPRWPSCNVLEMFSAGSWNHKTAT